MFTDAEIAFLGSQRLGRVATVDKAGEPYVVPAAFRLNPELDTIDIGGHSIGQSKKFRDVAGTGRVAFVVDDVLPPWRPPGVEVRGRGQALADGGRDVNADFDAEMIRIQPSRIVAWGIDTDAFTRNSRTIADQ